MRRGVLMPLLMALALGGAGTAAGDGGPGPGVAFGWAGITHGNMRYVTVAGPRWTTVESIQRNGGKVWGTLTVKGMWGIPLVAYDGTTGGLMPDGQTLLLGDGNAGPYLRSQSGFMFVDVKHMRKLRTFWLKGDFSYDALSPDGHYLYLIEHTTATDLTQYRVRAYDLKADRLLRKIVADRRSWDTTMSGTAITRLSTDGWAYTLYGGSSSLPFIHALDTGHVAAVCINMPWKAQPDNIWRYRLRTDGDGHGHLIVQGPRGRALVTIDRHSFRVLSSVSNP
jgi:hypothetical protein